MNETPNAKKMYRVVEYHCFADEEFSYFSTLKAAQRYLHANTYRGQRKIEIQLVEYNEVSIEVLESF